MSLYIVVTPYATFGLLVHERVVVESGPIGRWTVGKKIDDVQRYYQHRRACRVVGPLEAPP